MTCDYLYIQSSEPQESEFSSVDSEPSGWSDTTALYANFNDEEKRLEAGDSNLIGSIEGYQIYRRKHDESYMEYMGVVHKGEQNVDDFIIDYSAKNREGYVYYLYPNTDISSGGTELSPFVTREMTLDCPTWCLFVVDESEDENIFYIDKMFKFGLNLQIGDMTNNAQISITQNFTKYPTIQRGASNYWSGSLSALCGFISSNCTDYIQTTNMVNEIKSLTTETRRKFLKDTEGNLWEVDIAASIDITTETTALRDLKTLRLSWVEIADASRAIIINDPNKRSIEWVLTETGEAIPYLRYGWDDKYKWDDSYLWTGNDDVYGIDRSNIGRSIEK